MTSDEVAAYLRVDVVTIRRLVNRGELSAYRVGGEYRFMRRDLEEYLKRQRVPGADEGHGDPLDALAGLVRKMFAGDRTPVLEGRERSAFGRFTKRTQRALQFAQEEAQRLNHNYIGTEHLLLGLVREDEGLAARVLKSMGVQLEQVRSAVEFIIGHGDHVVMGEVPLTPRAKKVIQLAVDEARRLDHQFIGTEHLLLGLIREGEGVGAQVLEKLGVDLRAAREKTIELLDEKSGTAPSAAIPEEAAALVAEGAEAQTCERCGARNPLYFRFCFHCGQALAQD
ncbi:MAG TPA: Clp protease N-terminal domain-containing protein [Ktedonobacterales bacterium]|nr:Clp protease N-terminal domain-containing protein [Ktedonobacterales bacterium]